MRLADFDYDLPPEQIAQRPLDGRTSSRLMVVDRTSDGPATDAGFGDIARFLDPGDLLVVNRSRVVPARLLLSRETGASVEALYLRREGERAFVAWMRPLGRLRPGENLRCEDGQTRLRFEGVAGEREGRLTLPGGGESVDALLDRLGHVPLPPYIRRPDTEGDRDRYQTVYARERGSVAAPTAGLHFDQPLLATLGRAGIELASIVLHVGTGTFAPLEHDDVESNTLHSESVAIDARALRSIAAARAEGRRVVAVGTTVARALESAHALGWLDGTPADRAGETNLFIYPGYTFQVVDLLVTNFHLPRSSLLMLVCAFAGRARVLSRYREAVERGYRFFSYGDAMLIR